MTTGERIKELREYIGINQRDFAAQILINNSVLSRIESGERPIRDEELKRIADVLGTTTDFLLGRTDKRNDTTAEQAEYMESLNLETPEDAIKFILEQPSIAAFGGYDLNDMSEDEIMNLANDILFAMKLSLERNRKRQ